MTKINNILDEIRKVKEERITNVPPEIIGKNNFHNIILNKQHQMIILIKL